MRATTRTSSATPTANFNGADLRITNKSIDTLTVTAYGKYYREDSTSPLAPLSAAARSGGE